MPPVTLDIMQEVPFPGTSDGNGSWAAATAIEILIQAQHCAVAKSTKKRAHFFLKYKKKNLEVLVSFFFLFPTPIFIYGIINSIK